MEEEIKDTLIQCEKEKEFKFSLSFKIILGVSIFLTGISSFAGLYFTYYYISKNLWNKINTHDFLFSTLFYVSILICLISLITIAVIKKPFSKILVRCFEAIGFIFLAASFIFPRIPGYQVSGFEIFSSGDFTLIDGLYFMIGLLGIIFSRIIHYGFIYQKDVDMTV